MLVTGWGAPRLTAELLDSAPRLALVLYAAGSVRPLVTEESWARGVRVTSAGTVIADKVADFALAQILYALKHGWRYVLTARRTGRRLSAEANSAPRAPPSALSHSAPPGGPPHGSWPGTACACWPTTPMCPSPRPTLSASN